MATTKIAKKLPKRVGNERLKARRSRSWERGRERKAARIAAQRKREQHNLLRASPRPWDLVKAQARAGHIRAADMFIITRTTSYTHIRIYADRLLGGPITPSYLDDIHRRWRRIGKLAKAGRL